MQKTVRASLSSGVRLSIGCLRKKQTATVSGQKKVGFGFLHLVNNVMSPDGTLFLFGRAPTSGTFTTEIENQRFKQRNTRGRTEKSRHGCHLHGALAGSVSPSAVFASGATAVPFSAAAPLPFTALAPLFALLSVSAPAPFLPGAWTSAPAATSPFPEMGLPQKQNFGNHRSLFIYAYEVKEMARTW